MRGWSIDALKQYVDERFRENSRRLDGMNELREQINKERGYYVSSEIYEQRHLALEIRISSIEKWQAKIVGAVALAYVVLPGIVAVAIYFLERPR